MVAVVRSPSEWGHSVHFFPVVAGALQARNLRADFMSENFRATRLE